MSQAYKILNYFSVPEIVSNANGNSYVKKTYYIITEGDKVFEQHYWLLPEVDKYVIGGYILTWRTKSRYKSGTMLMQLILKGGKLRAKPRGSFTHNLRELTKEEMEKLPELVLEHML